jgi:hypothetical protein
MQLTRGETAYVVQEELIETGSIMDPELYTKCWVASMEGREEKTDAVVSMTREGRTPTEALEYLMEAMKAAGIKA